MPKNISVSIYFLTVNNGNTKRISEICSKLTDVRTKLTNRFHLLLWCFQYWLWTNWLCRLWSLIWRQCVSGGKKCSFFGKFGVLCFLETPVLRFSLLPYHRRFQVTWHLFFFCIYILKSFSLCEQRASQNKQLKKFPKIYQKETPTNCWAFSRKSVSITAWQRSYYCDACCQGKNVNICLNKVLKASSFNPSCPDPGQREKNDFNFYFRTPFWCLEKFYESFKGLHKTFWGTTKKCENKNWS